MSFPLFLLFEYAQGSVSYFFFSTRRRHTRWPRDWSFRRVLFRSRSDPGRPEVCNVFTLHGHFTDPEQVAEIEKGCRAATLGCVQCKGMLAEAIGETFAPIRERAAEYRARPELVHEILGDGAARCRRLAGETLREVRDRMRQIGSASRREIIQ